MSCTTIQRIPIKQGEGFTVNVTVKDEDGNAVDYSTGYTAQMQIRQTEHDDTIRDDLDTEGSTSVPARITLDDGIISTGETTSPNVVMTWSTEQSSALSLDNSTVRQTYFGVGDLEILDVGGEVVASIRLNFEQILEVTI